MKINKIIFIEPEAESLNLFTRFRLPRLGNILLATIMRDLGYATQVYIEKKARLLGMKLEADLVAISTITATAFAAYELADHFRARGMRVVMGGPHVTFMSEEAMEHADYTVRGEGEKALPSLVKAIESDTGFSSVPGLAWMEDGRIRMNEPASPIADLNSLPVPDFDLVYRAWNTLEFGKRIVPIQTSRGCPFDCTFCSVTGMFGRRYRFRSVENVIAELKRYNPKTDTIFFYDDNFTADKRHSKELLKAMIAENLGFVWSTQVRSDIALDDELLDLMREAGCNTLYIGFESIDPAALKEMKKSQTADQMRTAIGKIRARRIHIHGMFVFGFEADNEKTMRATCDFAIREKIDSAQFLILTPLPGTQFFSDMIEENRISDFHWTEYDAHHVKFRPAHFSGYALQRAQMRSHARFYAVRRIFMRLLQGKISAFLIGLYANKLNRKWKRLEHRYLRGLKNNFFPAPLVSVNLKAV
jgi:radical SAM superfamily enzyme YgiQ (UPF0313 family)